MWQNDLSTTGAKHQTFERHRRTAKRKIWKPGWGVRQFQPLARHCTVSCLFFKFSCSTYELIVYNTKYWLLIPNACGSFQSWRRPKNGAGWKTFRSLLWDLVYLAKTAIARSRCKPSEWNCCLLDSFFHYQPFHNISFRRHKHTFGHLFNMLQSYFIASRPSPEAR